ncbi:phage holin family protein [Synechococcus sp. CCY9201]|jgi:putative membrane protein|uniref:phage holin family protein n=1 Tax=unclassified Synechococcus TaxID=2626047 RepID=UPI0018CF8997|nr:MULTISPECIES: phage holin family protein [unclassified Synechococcus]MEA5475745.1 phage holin family protein [Synechococcus sp. CCY9201]QPN60987.1 phage holin family protein [Synechococcus sp. CBW1002]QPN67319.1 phage holin family protein [Synechococcus sp. CBW1006]
MGSLAWLLQWPIRAVVLLIVAQLPLGVEMQSFGAAVLAVIVISLLGALLAPLLKLLLAPLWVITSLGGLIAPISWLFDGLITVALFALAASLIPEFRLRNGLVSAVLGALVYTLLTGAVLRVFGLERG